MNLHQDLRHTAICTAIVAQKACNIRGKRPFHPSLFSSFPCWNGHRVEVSKQLSHVQESQTRFSHPSLIQLLLSRRCGAGHEHPSFPVQPFLVFDGVPVSGFGLRTEYRFQNRRSNRLHSNLNPLPAASATEFCDVGKATAASLARGEWFGVRLLSSENWTPERFGVSLHLDSCGFCGLFG